MFSMVYKQLLIRDLKFKSKIDATLLKLPEATTLLSQSMTFSENTLLLNTQDYQGRYYLDYDDIITTWIPTNLMSITIQNLGYDALETDK